MALEAADIIDIGGESTRPGFRAVSVDEEIRRVRPVIEALAPREGFPPISIDTTKPEVARSALAAGALVVSLLGHVLGAAVSTYLLARAWGWVDAARRRIARPRSLGERGERAAAAYLRKRGYRIRARNLTLKMGEIDLLADAPDGRTLVVVEVKAGRRDDIRPEVHVNTAKQRQLARLASHLVARFKLDDRPVRFDVIAVVFPPEAPAGAHPESTPQRIARGEPEIRHHEHAFESYL